MSSKFDYYGTKRKESESDYRDDILGHYSSISSEQSSAVIYIINVLVIIISLRTFVFCLQIKF